MIYYHKQPTPSSSSVSLFNQVHSLYRHVGCWEQRQQCFPALLWHLSWGTVCLADFFTLNLKILVLHCNSIITRSSGDHGKTP